MPPVENPAVESTGTRGKQAAGESSGTTQPVKAALHSRKTPIMVRFDPTLLKRVDAAARRRGISRSSWMQYVISKILDEGEI